MEHLSGNIGIESLYELPTYMCRKQENLKIYELKKKNTSFEFKHFVENLRSHQEYGRTRTVNKNKKPILGTKINQNLELLFLYRTFVLNQSWRNTGEISVTSTILLIKLCYNHFNIFHTCLLTVDYLPILDQTRLSVANNPADTTLAKT